MIPVIEIRNGWKQPRPQPPIQDAEAQIPAVVLPDTLPAPQEPDNERWPSLLMKRKELNAKNLLAGIITPTEAVAATCTGISGTR